VESGLATNLFELGCALSDAGDKSRARECFAEAAGKYPKPHSRFKARMASLVGVSALRAVGMIRGRRGVFRSSAA
jgi:TolA-binding protein